MPQIELVPYTRYAPIPGDEPGGIPRLLPRVQFRCWMRVPGSPIPRDGIIDTGSPFTWLPEEVWQPLRLGVDYEWLPFAAGYPAPRAQTAGWSFSFRFARFLQPVGLSDGRTELPRDGVIAQFASGNPPVPSRSQRPAFAVIGLYGGLLTDTRLHISTDASGNIAGVLGW